MGLDAQSGMDDARSPVIEDSDQMAGGERLAIVAAAEAERNSRRVREGDIMRAIVVGHGCSRPRVGDAASRTFAVETDERTGHGSAC